MGVAWPCTGVKPRCLGRRTGRYGCGQAQALARCRTGPCRARAPRGHQPGPCPAILQPPASSGQILRPGQFARQRIADPDRQGRAAPPRLRLHHIKMGVEGRDLVDLGLGQASSPRPARADGPPRDGRVHPGSGASELDQQIAPARPIAQQRAHALQRAVLQLTPLRCATALAATAFPNSGGFIQWRHDPLLHDLPHSRPRQPHSPSPKPTGP